MIIYEMMILRFIPSGTRAEEETCLPASERAGAGTERKPLTVSVPKISSLLPWRRCLPTAPASIFSLKNKYE